MVGIVYRTWEEAPKSLCMIMLRLALDPLRRFAPSEAVSLQAEAHHGKTRRLLFLSTANLDLT